MTTPKKKRDDDKDDAPTPEDVREQKREASRESDTVDEATSKQEALAQRFPATLDYPTWLYCDDGRSQIVNSEQEGDELKETGGNWQTEPYPEHPSLAPPQPTQLPAGPGGFARPDQGLPGGFRPPPKPDQGLPGGKPRPDHTLPDTPSPKK